MSDNVRKTDPESDDDGMRMLSVAYCTTALTVFGLLMWARAEGRFVFRNVREALEIPLEMIIFGGMIILLPCYKNKFVWTSFFLVLYAFFWWVPSR